ncbi:MAG: hypothetical protein J7M15_04970 [Anaerolineae bacterium]|nr:hypothetical protein [Anaerolineae bacterium]
MQYSEAPLSPEKLYSQAIPITIVDPAERARFASQSFEFKAVNEAVMPADQENRRDFLSDLGEFIRTGSPGDFVVVEENLRELYLVAIGSTHRISRKVYATHPLMPGKLLVIGGIGIVRPDEANHCLTLETPMQDLTLHQLLPDLAKTSMSAANPTPKKTIESIPNEDPVGGYSIRIAEDKYRNVEMISKKKGGIDPAEFPVITNVAWGIVGQALAFYVYAVPDNAVPVCELLHATSRAEIAGTLGRYIGAGQRLMRALRHLHQAGYVFNQPHQGNVYCYQDKTGKDRILISDLDTLQSIRGFSRKVPPGEYLSPMAFATLVNIQVASTHIAHLAWIDFFRGVTRELRIGRFPGADGLYASIVCELLAGYISLHERRKIEIHSSIRSYYNELRRQVRAEASGTRGMVRLMRSDLYEMDVFGFLFTYLLMDDDYCREFGARCLTKGINEKLGQMAKTMMPNVGQSTSRQAMAMAINQARNQIMEERSNRAMQEFLQALSKRKRVSRRTSEQGA